MCIYVYYYSISTGLNVKIQFKSTSFSVYIGELFKMMHYSSLFLLYFRRHFSLCDVSQCNTTLQRDNMDVI